MGLVVFNDVMRDKRCSFSMARDDCQSPRLINKEKTISVIMSQKTLILLMINSRLFVSLFSFNNVS
jgi:hypothetical protein